MSKKTDLIKCFSEYKSRYEAVQNQVTEIEKSLAYTAVGKEQAIQRAVDGFLPTVQTYHDKAVNIVDAGLDALAEKWRKGSTGKLADSGYQAGLSNVMQMLQMGAVKEQEDVQNIIDAYTGDFNALAVIKSILLQSKDERLQGYAAMVPVDNRDNNKRLLLQLRGNVDSFINIDTVQTFSKSWNGFNQGLTSVSMSMDRIDRLTIKARDKLEPPQTPWERIMLKNPYINQSRDELMELLSSPQDDWREIVQACVWTRGG